ncbi:MAG: sigma-70 family RNA polymerase sigma factor [Xanthomonadales bacterium]|nr:sigma-70 family RNA polymerase sigma factor [Xanthomonadales bacterium]
MSRVVKDELALLLALHQDRVYRIALGIAGQCADAEDIMQEALLSIARGHRDFRGDAALSTWIYRITLRTALAWMARHRRGEAAGEAHPDLSAHADAPLDLSRALARLPLAARTVLMLVAVEGFSHAEAARLLEIPEGTVASRLHHARAQLRRALG